MTTNKKLSALSLVEEDEEVQLAMNKAQQKLIRKVMLAKIYFVFFIAELLV